MEPFGLTQVAYDMAWVAEPTAWVGLLTLAVIQIVLGIDNLVFIAVLSAKLPPRKRAKARYIGIGGALAIRLVLLMFAAYIMAFQKPLFTLFGMGISLRDLVMFVGGLFLLYKGWRSFSADGFSSDYGVRCTVFCRCHCHRGWYDQPCFHHDDFRLDSHGGYDVGLRIYHGFPCKTPDPGDSLSGLFAPHWFQSDDGISSL